jgi:hypothetical protein
MSYQLSTFGRQQEEDNFAADCMESKERNRESGRT